MTDSSYQKWSNRDTDQTPKDIKLIDNGDDTYSIATKSLTSTDINRNELGTDAWERNKTVKDYSMFHGMFTLEVPDEMWIEYFNGVEVPKTNATSVNGELKIISNGGTSTLMSKRHPRYQPNRGLLYSDSGFVDNATDVNSGKLYGVRRSLVDGVVVETKTELSIENYQNSLDKGHVRDIQAQWRGVGDFNYFIDLEKVFKDELIGTLDSISVFNPAMSIAYECKNDGTIRWGLFTPHSGIFYEWVFDTPQETQLRIGCCDLSSEGGFKENRQRGEVDTDEIALSAAETPVIAIYLPPTIDYNGTQTMNTRDIALRLISGFADDNTLMRVYYTRDASKFTNINLWSSQNKIGSVLYAIDGDIVIDNLTTNIKRIATRRIPAFGDKEISNPDEQYGDFYLTHGDIILVTMKAKNQTQGGASIEWGAEI